MCPDWGLKPQPWFIGMMLESSNLAAQPGYHTVLITIALQYSLKSGSVMDPALFFLKIALTFQGLL